MSTIEIRTALLTDARDIAEVHVQSWRETYRGIIPADYLASLSVSEREKNWQNILQANNLATGTFVAVREDGSMAGFGCCGKQRSAERPATGEYYAIYVLKTAQRGGVGRSLMAAMSAHLRTQNLHSALVWVVRENAAARRFYEALGGAYVTEKEDKSFGFSLWETAYEWQTLPTMSA